MVDILKVWNLVACLKGLDKEEEAVWSGSSLFAIHARILLFPAVITAILFEKKKSKVFEILEHLP